MSRSGMFVSSALVAFSLGSTTVDRISDPVHERSPRAIAMALQAILVRIIDRMPKNRTVILIELEDHTIEVVLGDSPTSSVRHVDESDVHLKTTAAELSHYLNTGKLHKSKFKVVAGDKAAAETFFGVFGA